jgi:hypothetical protein
MTTVPRSPLSALLAAPHVLVAALALALAVPAAAQQTTGNPFQVKLVNDANQAFSLADCESATQTPIEFGWVLPVSISQQEEVYVSKSTACETSGTLPLVTKRARDQAVQSSANFTNAAPTPRRLFAFASGSDDCGGASGVEQSLFLCVRIETPSSIGGNPTVTHASYKIGVDSKPPATPTLATVSALEGGLLATWTMPEDTLGAAGFRVYVTDPSNVESVTKIVGGATREISITGLALDTPYGVQVSAVDAAGNAARPTTLGNESARSNLISGTPVSVQDFFERYGELGGTESGGCAAGGLPLPTLGALALLLLLRRRRARAGAATLAAVALLAAPAAAQVRLAEDPTIALRSERQSPQTFTFELLVGPYQPDVDAEPGLTGTPFADIFGNATPALWRVALSFDFLHTPFGRFGAGAAIGYWQANGTGVYGNDPDSPSLDSVTLDLIPLSPFLSYRADFIYDRWNIPFVPYLKLGYGFTYWNSKVNGAISTRTTAEGTGVAEGWARGLEYAGGLQFVLDFLEPRQAAALDNDIGINSTALFVEAANTAWEGKGGLRLGGTAITGGLALMF